MNLIPAPRKITSRKGSFTFSPDTVIRYPEQSESNLGYPLELLAKDIDNATSARSESSPYQRNLSSLSGRASSPSEPALIEGAPREILLLTTPGHKTQGYSLTITLASITLEASDSSGLVNGVQTLRQIIQSHGATLPCLTIRDWPDFAVRGFYHDVTRGKVPTLKTLMELADKMAFYKLNQLQLYVEHTFAFKKHPDIWEGADPLTAEEIRTLASHCERLNIDLVPSLSTFGHFYTAIRSKRKEHLNELNVQASEIPYSLWDRMAHYTLDCSNPESLELVTDMIEELIPLFKSKYFNICCDETFDLGKGKNAARMKAQGEGGLYLGFLKRIMKVVTRNGKIPMFWGDIVIQDATRLSQLPANAVALNWDYDPVPKNRPCGPFKKAGLKFYVCPGVHGWNNFTNHIPNATANIIAFTQQGKKFGAEGVLNTDWGDYGHINSLAGAYHGMILGAAASWNLKAAEKIAAFEADLERREFGDTSGQTCSLLREAAVAVSFKWSFISWLFDPSPDIIPWEKDAKTGMMVEALKQDSGTYLASYLTLLTVQQKLIQVAKQAKPADRLAYRELICGVTGAALMHAVALLFQTASGYSKAKHGLSFHKTADAIRVFERDYSDLWHLRNKPSEYWRLKAIFIGLARRLDAFA